MISFIIGLFVGSFIGVALIALMYMAKDYEPKKREPAKIWTKGDLCQWKGDTYVIYAMETDGRNSWQRSRRSDRPD